ncbi:MAG: lamin tail domain-containing protein [Candidatus Aegiribacteria sp.]|nr:lamin tail domain-containing protein [Candidatus Aegiribacteria sp.]
MKLVFVLCLLVSALAFSQADHLLLTEICDTPTDGEFVEIYNPTVSTIPLSLVHLTDLYGDSSCVDDFYPQIALGPISYQSSYDFLVQFPLGDVIAPGEVIVIAMSGLAFETEYGVQADYDIRSTGGGATPMVVPTNGFAGSSAGFTNSGETITMFLFDDASDSGDLCYDIDYAVWGDDAGEFVDKSYITINTASYLNDTPEASQDAIYYTGHAYGMTFQRVDMYEGTETLTGGNGLTGHDETSENLSVTWLEGEPTPGFLYTALERETWGSIKSTF